VIFILFLGSPIAHKKDDTLLVVIMRLRHN